MSATGRGTARRESDYYPTPAWCVAAILDRLHLPGGHWLEPTAGDGAIIRAVQARRQDVRFTACELREECRASLEEVADKVLIGDFRLLASAVQADVAILNPPFSLALEIVSACLDKCGFVVALERLNWLSGKGRARWLRSHTPDVYVLPERPSFTGEGTDACEYAWLVWPPGDGHFRRVGLVEVLDLAPRQMEMVA